MSVKDVIKNSVYESLGGGTTMTVRTVALILLAACLMGVYIFSVYRLSGKKAFSISCPPCLLWFLENPPPYHDPVPSFCHLYLANQIIMELYFSYQLLPLQYSTLNAMKSNFYKW